VNNLKDILNLKYNRILLAIFFYVVLTFSTCKPAPNHKSDFFNWVKKGEITVVSCKSEISNIYSLYLPSNYNIEKTWPLVYCFDPHGDGSLPVGMLKTFAEKQGFILVGSNKSRNGLNAGDLSFIIETLMQDVNNKLALNPRRTYTIGFSGGARVACSMALTYKNISGVVACSAGFRPAPELPLFSFIGIAGSMDMNYLEMKQLDYELNNYTVRHQFYVFDNKHQWPPATMLQKAILNLELMNMADEKIEKNVVLIDSIFKATNLIIKNLIASENTDSLLAAKNEIDNAMMAFKDLKDLSDLELLYDKISGNIQLQQLLKNTKLIEEKESKEQQKYSSALPVQSIGWWKDEINLLNRQKLSKEQLAQSRSVSRLLAFISLMSFSYVNSSINQNDWQSAGHLLKIYGMADPENPDYHYFNACYLANVGKMTEAYESLKMAVKFGFADKQKLANDPLLEGLRKKYDLMKLKN
jgi:hypothetical protein